MQNIAQHCCAVKHDKDKDEDNQSELSDGRPHPKSVKQKAHRFCNEDLPGLPATGLAFRDTIIPQWIFYYSSLNSPWKLTNPDYVDHVQKLWDKTITNVPCTVALCDEPIFALVSLLFHWTPMLMQFKVKQWTYDWCSDLAAHAHKSVESYFNCYKNFATAADQAKYVKWAVPKTKNVINSCGAHIPIAVEVFPYMWASITDGPNGLVSHQSTGYHNTNYVQVTKGAFLHKCILDTFAFYLESTKILKLRLREKEGGQPRGARTLATVAVSLFYFVNLHHTDAMTG